MFPLSSNDLAVELLITQLHFNYFLITLVSLN